MKWQALKGHPGVQWRPSPTSSTRKKYRTTYRDATGRAHTHDEDRLDEIETFKAEKRAQRRAGTLPDVDLARETFKQYADHYMKTKTEIRPKTRSLYAMQLRVHIVPELGALRVPQITRPVVKDFYAALLAKGVGKPTVGGVKRLLHAMLEEAVREGRIPANHAHGVQVPRPQEREVEPLDASEIWALADQVDSRYRALVLVLGFTGLRIGEVTALRFRDIDLPGTTVRVELNAPEDGGKRLEAQPPKSAASRRTADLPEPVVVALRAHVSGFANRFDPDSLLFTTARGGPVGQKWFNRHLQDAAGRAGVERFSHVHQLRHSAASLFIASGWSIPEVARQLGQNQVSVTLRYGHAFASARSAKIDALSQFLNG